MCENHRRWAVSEVLQPDRRAATIALPSDFNRCSPSSSVHLCFNVAAKWPLMVVWVDLNMAMYVNTHSKLICDVNNEPSINNTLLWDGLSGSGINQSAVGDTPHVSMRALFLWFYSFERCPSASGIREESFWRDVLQWICRLNVRVCFFFECLSPSLNVNGRQIFGSSMIDAHVCKEL